MSKQKIAIYHFVLQRVKQPTCPTARPKTAIAFLFVYSVVKKGFVYLPLKMVKKGKAVHFVDVRFYTEH